MHVFPRAGAGFAHKNDNAQSFPNSDNSLRRFFWHERRRTVHLKVDDVNSEFVTKACEIA